VRHNVCRFICSENLTLYSMFISMGKISLELCGALRNVSLEKKKKQRDITLACVSLYRQIDTM
jgi:hypothetical protein